MLDSLTKIASPHRHIDHEIELLPGEKLPTKNMYYIVLPKLVELKNNSINY